MKRRITEQTIKKMKAPDEGYRIEWDSEIRGFGAYITSAGRVRFILNYRFDGRAQRYAIGQYPEWTSTAARAEAVELKKKIRGSKDYDVEPVNPLEERHKDRAAPTLGTLATEYLASDAESRKRLSPTAAQWDSIGRALGKFRLSECVEPSYLKKLKDSYKDKSTYMPDTFQEALAFRGSHNREFRRAAQQRINRAKKRWEEHHASPAI